MPDYMRTLIIIREIMLLFMLIIDVSRTRIIFPGCHNEAFISWLFCFSRITITDASHCQKTVTRPCNQWLLLFSWRDVVILIYQRSDACDFCHKRWVIHGFITVISSDDVQLTRQSDAIFLFQIIARLIFKHSDGNCSKRFS